MRNVEPLHRENPLSTIRIEHDPSNDSHWCFMHGQQAFSDPNYRACFSPRLLRELRLFAQETIDGIAGEAAKSDTHLAHIVLSSDAHVLNLGGALNLVSQLSRTPHPDGLLPSPHQQHTNIHTQHTTPP